MLQFNAVKSPTALAVVDGCLITPWEERFVPLWANGKVISVLSQLNPNQDPNYNVLQADGCYVTPGLIDLQVNGGPECNLWADPDQLSLSHLRKTMARCGVTGFLPTLITDDIGHLKNNIDRIGQSEVSKERVLLSALSVGKGAQTGIVLSEISYSARRAAARMLGIHLEGPFLSPEKPGVHPPQWVAPLSVQSVSELVTEAVSLVTLAPERDPSGESIRFLRERGIRVSLGHSNATFEEAKQAFDRGVTLMTHTFNALPPLHHRAPGAVCAAFLDPRVFCCVIADGLHVDPSIVELIVRIKGAERTILVTDRAHVGTSEGGLVGSSLTLDQAVRNVVNWGIASFPDAIRMASWNPAVALGLEHGLGHLAAGKLADFVLWDRKTLEIKDVVVGGELV